MQFNGTVESKLYLSTNCQYAFTPRI